MQQTLQRFEPTTNGGLSRVEVLEGPTGRRKWPDEVKARIVAETLVPGARVCEVARRYGVAAQYLTTWRTMARDGRLVLPEDAGSPFATMAVDRLETEQRSDRSEEHVEIEFAGVIVRLVGKVSTSRVCEIVAGLRSLA